MGAKAKQFPDTGAGAASTENKGIYFEESENTLYVTFKNKQSKDTHNCLKLLKSIIFLSTASKNVLKVQDKAPKKMNQTAKIRLGIQTFVNKQNVSDKEIDALIASIRKGKIERIKTFLNEKELFFSAKTDFDMTLINLLTSNN